MIHLHLSYVHYCYENLISQIPVGLLLYSHVPTALVALVFGGYVAVKARNRVSLYLLGICLLFATWCLFDLGSWFALTPGLTMFGWGLLDLTSLAMYFFAYCFLYTFITGKRVPTLHKIVVLVLALPVIVTTLLGLNLPVYDADACAAIENELPTQYAYFVEGFIILASVWATARQFRKEPSAEGKRRAVLAGIGVVLFLTFFLSANLVVSLLAQNDTSLSVYNFEIYGLFGMPVLLAYLGFLIVRYRAFNLKVFGAQALVLALVALIGSEFAFLQTMTNRILVAITLVLTGAIGIVLIRSVRREIAQREHIEQLATELEKANEQQVVLIHFITHQIKGFVTKSRNIFSMMLEGEFGPVPETMKPMVEEGFRSDTKGANTIQEILNAANIKSGKVTYAQEAVDLKALTEGIIGDLKPAADAKGLALSFATDGDGFTITGDAMQLTNAIKNLIDNSIKYTPQGSVAVALVRKGDTLMLTIEDTGVGITSEDMQNLFTEGGHGKESTKVNVDSTGFGLYIVKNIIVGHHGRVWAESDGAGKGSRFVVELPAN